MPENLHNAKCTATAQIVGILCVWEERKPECLYRIFVRKTFYRKKFHPIQGMEWREFFFFRFLFLVRNIKMCINLIAKIQSHDLSFFRKYLMKIQVLCSINSNDAHLSSMIFTKLCVY